MRMERGFLPEEDVWDQNFSALLQKANIDDKIDETAPEEKVYYKKIRVGCGACWRVAGTKKETRLTERMSSQGEKAAGVQKYIREREDRRADDREGDRSAYGSVHP